MARGAAEHTLLVHALRVLVGVERRLGGDLSRRAAQTADVQLRKGLERHADETRPHALGLETALRVLGEAPEPLGSPALDGLAREQDEALVAVPETAKSELRDLVLAAEASFDDERRMVDEGKAVFHRLAAELTRRHAPA